VNIIFKGRHTDVLDRFRKHATAKLAKLGKLDSRVIRIDVEVSAERNPRQSPRRERVELTISSRGPAIRAEAAAEDRYAALDMAVSKLESRLRRVADRRKCRHGAHAAVRVIDLPAANTAEDGEPGAEPERTAPPDGVEMADAVDEESSSADAVVPIQAEGNGPLVVREKYHTAQPMAIDQALFEMELVGHDFFLFRDTRDGRPSVVYRRRGYQYGVIRLVEEDAAPAAANGQAKRAEQLAAR
jgi:ribosomal subunit interface protein